MATYINYGEGEEDATVQGAEWLQNVLRQTKDEKVVNGFLEKFKELQSVESHKYDVGPIFDLFLDNAEELFDCIPESGKQSEERLKEVESFFALVLSLLLLLEDDEHLNKSTVRLCDLFSGGTTQPELRLRLLMMLYNTFNLPSFEYRYNVFKYVVDYAAKVSLFDQVLPYLEYLDAWMVDWDKFMTMDDKRSLYRDISAYMRQLNKRTEAFVYLKKYHLLWTGEAEKKLGGDEVQKLTVQLLMDAIQLPSVIQFDDLLSFETVKVLAKGKTTSADLTQLCKVFLSGSVQDLRDFHGKHEKLFKEYELSFQDALSKVRLLTLATIAHARAELSLAEIAKALEEKEENIEPWVVRAISEGVIDGRIDQLNHRVLVKSSFQRKFEKEEWAFLDSKVSQWIDNLESVIKFIGEQQALRTAAVN
eukprot:TRINITY_DN267_c0_g1_i1.p1 TRINITY_DN267_c0_g1~~TRINITY_DN267_c0_g1_i1.p1  ORF type:complete len:420 (-),score=152.72 TRINITY_DN267_c0_g1_i1:445-1704(-)